MKIVVAHPDDEILFFSSQLDEASEVIICFSECKDEVVTAGRLLFIQKCDIKKFSFLQLREADCHDIRNWDKPLCTEFGLNVRNNIEKYTANYARLLSNLRLKLNKGDVVFTHNPWGDYGHEEHVQIFKVLFELREELDLKLYVSGYVSNRSHSLMEQSVHYLSATPVFAQTNKALATKLMQLYKDTRCWTWYEEFYWPECEVFYPVTEKYELQLNKMRTASMPLSYLTDRYDQKILIRLLGKFFTQNALIFMKSCFKRN
jgi:LmbE family N-acetylglucosaminyl deacetylase